MAAQLSNFYKQATNEFGVVGRMKLAMLTKISSEKADAEPDSPANIQVFEKAMSQLRMGAA
jgi:hypothetical protein